MTRDDSGSESFELNRRAAEGDAAAMEQLLEEYLPSLRAFVRLRATPELRAQESVSDVVQSVCREVLTHADRFQHPGEGAFRSWLFTTARRKVLNRLQHLRAEKRDAAREVRVEDLDAQALMARYASFSTPSGHAVQREQIERVEAAFDRLRPEQREAVLLAHVVGLSRAEIGQQMNKSEGAVRVLLHRALARLGSLIDPGAREEFDAPRPTSDSPSPEAP